MFRKKIIFPIVVFLIAAIIIYLITLFMNPVDTSDLTDDNRLSVLRQMNLNEIEELKKNKQYEDIIEAILPQFLNDAVFFPVPISSNNPQRFVSYENSWGNERSYGYERRHEGTDIMADYNVRGYYPVISISDGIVEKMGWLELGGYRLGIRCESGGYFYYAHLYDYADGIREGVKIKAGQLIGYMGDSGYSKVEGTVGNFDVHLHVGIYVMYQGNELSINPYYLLKRLQIMKADY